MAVDSRTPNHSEWAVILPICFSKPVPRFLRAALIVGLGCLLTGRAYPVLAQSEDATFREFPPELVPGPDQLNQKLVSLGAVAPSGLSAEWLNTFLEQQRQMLSDLTPQQRQNLANLANQYLRDRGIDPSEIGPQQVPELARDIAQQMQGADPQFEEFRRRFSEFQRQQTASQDPSGRLGNRAEPSGGMSPWPVDPRGRNARTPVDSPPETQPVPSPPPENAPAAPGQTGGDDPGPASNSGPRAGPAAGKRVPGDPSPGAPRPGAAGSGPQERIGVRFDRLIVEAAQRGLESTSAETRSRLAQSVNSLLDGLAANIESVIREHASNRSNSRSGSDRQSAKSRSALFSKWHPLSGEMDAPAIRPWWLLVLIAAAVSIWLLIRYSGGVRPLSADPKRRRNVQFRFRKIRSADGLVASVDEFLLARFGQPASWWDVRRAQAALGDEQLRRVSDSRIDELATAYELARYTTSSGTLTSEQLDRLGETLRELALNLSAAAAPATRVGS